MLMHQRMFNGECATGELLTLVGSGFTLDVAVTFVLVSCERFNPAEVVSVSSTEVVFALPPPEPSNVGADNWSLLTPSPLPLCMHCHALLMSHWVYEWMS